MKDPEHCAARIKALADPSRLQLVFLLLSGEISVTKLAEAAGQDVVKTSHHLNILLREKIVSRRKQNRFVYYSLNPAVICHDGDEEVPQIDLGTCRVGFFKSALGSQPADASR